MANERGSEVLFIDTRPLPAKANLSKFEPPRDIVHAVAIVAVWPPFGYVEQKHHCQELEHTLRTEAPAHDSRALDTLGFIGPLILPVNFVYDPVQKQDVVTESLRVLVSVETGGDNRELRYTTLFHLGYFCVPGREDEVLSHAHHVGNMLADRAPEPDRVFAPPPPRPGSTRIYPPDAATQ